MKRLILFFVIVPFIGLIGHSEGGLIAPMVATDIEVAFMVLLAAPGISGSQVLLKQLETISRSRGVDEQSIQTQLRISRGIFELFTQWGK